MSRTMKHMVSKVTLLNAAGRKMNMAEAQKKLLSLDLLLMHAQGSLSHIEIEDLKRNKAEHQKEMMRMEVDCKDDR
jgi:hypothetical protein